MNIYDVVNNAEKEAIKNYVNGLTVAEFLEKMDETFKDNVRYGLKLSTNIYLDFYDNNLDELLRANCDYESVKKYMDKDEEILRDYPELAEMLNRKVLRLIGLRDPEVVNGFNDGMPYAINHYLNIVVE